MTILFVSCGFAFGQGAITFYPSEGSNGVEINATVTAERVEDRFGVANKAFRVSGDAMSYDDFELNGSSMSFSLWLKVDENQPGQYPQVFRFGERDGWPSIALELNKATNILGALNDVQSGVQSKVQASSRLQFGNWYHAAIVIENNQYHFYLNGILVGSRNLSPPLTGPSFWTGGSVPFAGGGFKGTLDEIKVFDYAIDAEFIEVLFTGVVPEPEAPTLPVFESFYESNPGETIVIDATPAEGYPTDFTYQWKFNGIPIPAFIGGTDATLSLNGATDQNGTWHIQVTNSEGSAEASFEYRVFVDDDSDTLSNYREENITLTNPNLADSDGDGLSDPDEIDAETDPNIADTDEDGVSDGAEVNTYGSNPRKVDTDDDGLSDGDEVNTYLSNPNNSDSDSDGIADSSEIAAGLDLNTADTIASAVAFLTAELANRPEGFDEAMATARLAGQNDVISNPSTYGLYSESVYNGIVAERDSRFLDSDGDGLTDDKETELETDTSSETVFYLQEALDSATANARSEGRSDVTNNPLDYSLVSEAEYNAVVAERDARPTQAESDAAVSQARITGRSDVISAPENYNLFSNEAYAAVAAERDARPTITAYNTAVAESLAIGRSSVTNNPSEYDLYRASEYNTVVAERDARPTQDAYNAIVAERDARFLDSDEDGITDVKEAELGTNNTGATLFYLQAAYDDARTQAQQSGKDHVVNNPALYDLYTTAQYAAMVAERDARPTQLAYNTVVAQRDARPTTQELNQAVSDATTSGREQVISNPSLYNLYTTAQYAAVIAERNARPTQDAYDAVVAQRDARPTLEEVKDARLGSVLLLPNATTNKVKIRFTIEESNELGAWTSRTEEAEVDIPLDPGKKFFRFSVKEDDQ